MLDKTVSDVKSNPSDKKIPAALDDQASPELPKTWKADSVANLNYEKFTGSLSSSSSNESELYENPLIWRNRSGKWEEILEVWQLYVLYLSV